jgi:hypothetical protein
MKDLSIAAKMRIKNIIVATVLIVIVVIIALLTPGCSEHLCPAYL